ncbi:hypothetical protein TNCV_1972611 [Trichonephila clavipes]|nr:hypothetical protein TNCV_1972611 [Trichonephila clavipes]
MRFCEIKVPNVVRYLKQKGTLHSVLRHFGSPLLGKKVCLRRIPLHVAVPGNEAADELAVRGCDLSNSSSSVLSHSEIHSLPRTKMNLTWQNPPAHHWYAAKRPGLSLQCRSSKAH